MDKTIEEQKIAEFQLELSRLINRHGMDTILNAQDFLISEFMVRSALLFGHAKSEWIRLGLPES